MQAWTDDFLPNAANKEGSRPEFRRGLAGVEPVAVRVNEKGGSGRGQSCSILGSASRNPITGRVFLKELSGGGKDYKMVDLFERSALHGSPAQLTMDPYVFKIVPLPYRTWMYHYFFKDSSQMGKSEGPNGIVEKVLAESAIDVPADGSRWSSAICYVLMAMLSVLTANFSTAFYAILMTAVLISVAKVMNTPGAYNWARLVTLPLRLGFLCLVLLNMLALTENGGMVLVGFALILVCFLIDFLGDYMSIFSCQNTCRYTIVRVLPNRVFIARRKGAFFVSDPEWAPVSEKVSGVGAWTENLVMIAEIQGLVCQLRPMTHEDWKMALEEVRTAEKPLGFVGLDIFNKSRRTVDEVDMECLMEAAEGGAGVSTAIASAAAAKAKAMQSAHEDESFGFLA